MKLGLVVAGVRKPGGANPETIVPTCWYAVIIEVVGTSVVAAHGLEARGACNLAVVVVVVVVGGIWYLGCRGRGRSHWLCHQDPLWRYCLWNRVEESPCCGLTVSGLLG